MWKKILTIAAVTGILLVSSLLFGTWVFTPYYTGEESRSGEFILLVSTLEVTRGMAPEDVLAVRTKTPYDCHAGEGEAKLKGRLVTGESDFLRWQGSLPCRSLRLLSNGELASRLHNEGRVEAKRLTERSRRPYECHSSQAGCVWLFNDIHGSGFVRYSDSRIQTLVDGSGNRFGSESRVVYSVGGPNGLEIHQATSRRFSHERFPWF